MRLEPAEFVRSAASKADFIRDERPCVVFSGRSNVGKSSVINCLVNRKNLARVGASPGKTTNINYFLAADSVWLVDLPGYGYARAPKTERERWGRLMEAFFAEPEYIRVGVQLVDARHKPTELDGVMVKLFSDCGCGLIVAANKWDKLKASEREPSLARIRQTLALPEGVPVIPFSAEKKTGRQELIEAIDMRIDV